MGNCTMLDTALLFGVAIAFALYLTGVLIVRDVAKEKGMRYNLWTGIVAGGVNLGMVAFLARLFVWPKVTQ